MRKMTGFFVSSLLLIGLAAPAWAGHGDHRDRHDRDGHSYYRDGRRYHDDGRYYYRDGRYRDGYYYGDDNYYRGRPTPDCPSGEWTYHPNTGWMCAG